MDTDVNFAEIISGKKSQAAGSNESKGPEHFTECSGLFVKSIDLKKRQITALASSPTIDRSGEVILPTAFDEFLPIYMKNPIVIASHQHRLDSGHSPVVGNVINAWINNEGLWVIIEFAQTDLGNEYWILYSAKTQRAFSVGFIPMEGENQQIDGKYVYTHTKVQLLEISCVPVPANPDALSKARQRKLDFVNSKRGIFDEEKFLAEQKENNPDFEAGCDDFAEILVNGIDCNEIIEEDHFVNIINGLDAGIDDSID